MIHATYHEATKRLIVTSEWFRLNILVQGQWVLDEVINRLELQVQDYSWHGQTLIATLEMET